MKAIKGLKKLIPGLKKSSKDKKEKKKDKKTRTPLLNQFGMEGTSPFDTVSTATITSNPKRHTVINANNVPSFNMIWLNYQAAVQNIEKDPIEYLYATVILRFAIEKELGKTLKYVTSEDTTKFIEQLNSGEITFDNIAKANQLNEQLRKLSSSEAYSRNSFLGNTIAIASSATEKISNSSLSPEASRAQLNDAYQIPQDVKLWAKFSIFLDAYQSKFRQEQNNNNKFWDAYEYARDIADKFSKIYDQYIQSGKEDALYYAEAEIEEVNNVQDYIYARKPNNLAKQGLSLEVSVTYAKAKEQQIIYPDLYAFLITKAGKSHEESIAKAVQLGERGINIVGFESYLANMDNPLIDDEEYCILCALAFQNDYPKPQIYAQEIRNGKTKDEAKAYCEGLELKYSEDEARIYAEKKLEGKSKEFIATYISAIRGGYEPHRADIYAETFEKTDSHAQARFNVTPTFSKWFNFHRNRNIIISCTGIGFLILLCIGSAKVQAQKNKIAERAKQYELKQQQNTTSPSKLVKQQVTSTQISPNQEQEMNTISYEKRCKRSQQQSQKNEETWKNARNENAGSNSNNNNNNKLPITELSTNSVVMKRTG